MGNYILTTTINSKKYINTVFDSSKTVSVDSKGRISMPTDKRATLSTLILTPNPIPSEPCLLIYTPEEWKKIVAHITMLPNTKPNRTLKRVFVGQAETLTLDNNGRFLIKPEFRVFASLEKKAKLVGQGNKLELWDEITWNTVNDITEEGYLEAVEALAF